MARALALLVAAAFAIAPLAIWLALLPGDEVTWRKGGLALVYGVGAALLAAGATRWYGRKARLLRVCGFVLLLAGALANVSFAFALVLIVLLATFSLRNRVRRPARPSSSFQT